MNLKGNKTMKKYQEGAVLLLRFAMAFTFLIIVAGRLGLLEKYSANWDRFLAYTAEVNSFAPKSIIPFLAVSATALEIIIAILLLLGYKTKWAALCSAILTLTYALAMWYSFGIKEPIDYSVFVDSAACFLLFTFPYYRWSLDEKISKLKINNKEGVQI